MCACVLVSFQFGFNKSYFVFHVIDVSMIKSVILDPAILSSCQYYIVCLQIMSELLHTCKHI